MRILRVRAETQVLDTAKLFSVEQLTVTIPDRQLGAKALSGHRVSSTRWYSKTRVIFVTSTGAEIKVWDPNHNPNPNPNPNPDPDPDPNPDPNPNLTLTRCGTARRPSGTTTPRRRARSAPLGSA